jgi:hypothetical protein
MNFAYGAETEALRKRLEPVANVSDIHQIPAPY